MTRLHRTVTVDAPIEAVFDLVADPVHRPRWDPGTVGEVAWSDPAPSIGATFRSTVHSGGRRPVTVLHRISALDPPVRVRVEGESRLFTTVDEFVLRATESNRTRIDHIVDVRFRPPAGPLTALAKGVLDRLADARMQRIEAALA